MSSVLQDQIDALVEEAHEQGAQQAMLTIAAMMLKYGISRVSPDADDIKRALNSYVIADEQPDGSWVLQIHSTDSGFSKSSPPFLHH